MPESRATHRRPRRRGRRPKTHAAVLAATSRLLETESLAELTVAQIIAAAGVGRTSFYEHFASKEDVVVRLVRGISAEVAEEIEPLFAPGERPPEERFADGLSRLIGMSVRYAPLVLTASEEWPAVPELRRLWFRMHDYMTDRLATLIRAERDVGRAPGGADAEALAACLVWTGERAFHVTMVAPESLTLGDRDALIAALVQLYVGAIYRRPVRPAASPALT
jgi:TetR/AcrR family transcriptional regulator, ethionamide resistance regulator